MNEDLKAFFETYRAIFEAIDECLKAERIVPALIFFYSSIDGFSALANRSNKEDKWVFINWVQEWMLSKYSLPCTAMDIYSARCGLLHLQKDDSDLVKNRKAKRLEYAWGAKDAASLQFALDKNNFEATAVKFEDLFWFFRKGMADCLDTILGDPDWTSSFNTKTKLLFSNIRP